MSVSFTEHVLGVLQVEISNELPKDI